MKHNIGETLVGLLVVDDVLPGHTRPLSFADEVVLQVVLDVVAELEGQVGPGPDGLASCHRDREHGRVHRTVV